MARRFSRSPRVRLSHSTLDNETKALALRYMAEALIRLRDRPEGRLLRFERVADELTPAVILDLSVVEALRHAAQPKLDWQRPTRRWRPTRPLRLQFRASPAANLKGSHFDTGQRRTSWFSGSSSPSGGGGGAETADRSLSLGRRRCSLGISTWKAPDAALVALQLPQRLRPPHLPHQARQTRQPPHPRLPH